MLYRTGLVIVGVVCVLSIELARPAPKAMPPTPSGDISMSLNPDTGVYEIRDVRFNWKLSGELGSKATHFITRKGRDAVGPYAEVGFDWNPGAPIHGTIRVYDSMPVVWFRSRYLKSLAGTGIVFPKFGSIPAGLHPFSYRDGTFAPPTFGLAKTATPWLLFDDSARSIVVSPASGFMVSEMQGSLKSGFGIGLENHVGQVPEGFNQDSLLVFDDGIGAAWDRWGSTMQKLYRKRTPSNDSDPILKDFGYWTDNGADYYYNYDPQKGYAGTLLELIRRYRSEGIPLGYLQLDSWWYQKSTNDPAGHPGGAKKNSKLPLGSWNRYGGLMEYRAHPDLFPDGLARFQAEAGLPLAVHNRWIDRESPYHERYKISGVGAVDPAWWNSTVDYLKSSGVICYEQDWLDQIYLNSPEMASKIGVGDAFTDGMADACKQENLSVQYCMGTPRFFLQGLKYSNLTTIRTSGDRFEPRKWADFLYVSQLAYGAGIWPWCDVFKSRETGNMIVSVLSAGPVGTGDAIGKESKDNILKAARIDGVIVKPDRPLLPCDQTYLDAAEKKTAPFLATTYTDQGGIRTTYVFAFPRPKGEKSVSVQLSTFGVSKASYVFDRDSNQGRFIKPNVDFTVEIGSENFAFLMIVPETASRMVVLGDLGKFVSTGKQRISAMEETPGGRKVRVAFAKGEVSVQIEGVSSIDPSVRALSGAAEKKSYDPATGRFAIEVRPKSGSLSAEMLIK